jgi:hypothetical protein
VGGEESIGIAGGRWRSTTRVAGRKIAACSEIAMSGTTDQRQSLLFQSRTRTATRQTAMTLSVLPNLEQTQLTGSQKGVRLRLNATVTPSSARSMALSGPVMSRPMPTTTAQSTMPGATARTRRSLRSCL